jgi:hypothetical protein
MGRGGPTLAGSTSGSCRGILVVEVDDTAEQLQQREVFEHASTVWDVAFNVAGGLLATASGDGTAWV